ncbi:MAG: SulP family inorganic anion transporter, partial [Chroococcales cyanobacterium]
GQSVINVKSGGRGRLSTLAAGIFLLVAILFLQDWVKEMPMAALVAVMIMVSIGTFRWSSITNISRFPRTDTAVMLTTMLVTILTRNFAFGVVTGIILSTFFFSRKIAQLVFVDKVLSDDGFHRTYRVAGHIFFLSREEFLESFDFTENLTSVTIDLTHAHLWDQGAVEVLDKAVLRFRRNGIEVELIGLNEASANLVDKLAVYSNVKV